VTWVGWAIVTGALFGAGAGLGMLVAGPLAGFVALRWGERYDLRREVLRAHWLSVTREATANAVADQRRALATKIEAALGGLAAG
jgi:hypothetical protein